METVPPFFSAIQHDASDRVPGLKGEGPLHGAKCVVCQAVVTCLIVSSFVVWKGALNKDLYKRGGWHGASLPSMNRLRRSVDNVRRERM